MLKRKYIVGAVAAMVTMLFASCGGGKAVTASKLADSGAKTFITSEDELAEVFGYMNYQLRRDVFAIMSELDIDESKISPDVEKIMNQEQMNAGAYFMKVASPDGDLVKSGKIDYTFNPKIGSFKGLPKGLEVSIPASKAAVKVAIKKDGSATAELNVNMDGNVSMDAKKLIGEDADDVSIKAFAVSAALKGKVKADVKVSEDFAEDGSNYIDYFDYDLEDAVIDSDLTFTCDVGMSICDDEGRGGKVILTVTVSLKGKLDEEAMDKIGNMMDRISRGRKPRTGDLAALPFNIEAKVSCYDDKGKVTYEDSKAAEPEEILEMLNAISSML